MINGILKILTNTKNQIEGQRIKEKYFLSRGYLGEWEYCISNNIYSTESLYCFVNNSSPLCECGEKRRFVSFTSGFIEHCEKCSRTKYNHMSRKFKEIIPDDIDFSLRPTLKEQLKTCLTGNKIASASLKKLNLNDKIVASTYYLDKSKRINERIYHILNDLYDIVRCKDCGDELDTFFSNVSGYRLDFCKKNRCSYKNKNTSPSYKTMITLYNQYHDKFRTLLGGEYTLHFCSIDRYLKDKSNSIMNITHHKCNQSYTRPIKYQGRLDCPYCFKQRSKHEIRIIQYLQSIVDDPNKVLSNVRDLIPPKEIDIVYKNIAIEFNGQAYHSFGKSSDSRFNNYMVEDKNIHKHKTDSIPDDMQLLQIFSSEWQNPGKQEIWKSIIASKTKNISTRIHARKCIIRIITPKIEKEFLNINHMQGYVPSSIRLGLFHQEELVFIMTFGKMRNTKQPTDTDFELLRASSKLFHNIPGAFSKLLNYFEKNYNPTSLTSYANKRWSKGNVYSKNKFDHIGTTPPGYFYIEGNNFDANPLLSRIQFQKHRLNKKLEMFNPDLTETENMYNHNYRKIYDCGHLIFKKNYLINN